MCIGSSDADADADDVACGMRQHHGSCHCGMQVAGGWRRRIRCAVREIFRKKNWREDDVNNSVSGYGGKKDTALPAIFDTCFIATISPL
jgi:hypothetical protein